MLRRTAVLLALTLLVGLVSLPAASARPRPAQAGPTCDLPESNAEALIVLYNFWPGRYWWDHTDLTVAVQAHSRATDEHLAAVHAAIGTWSVVLSDCFDGLITLTDVTGVRGRQADIVVHYVPTALGVAFGGYAICGAGHCPNIQVKSDLPPGWDLDPYDPELLGWITLHELGHALGLGHATNILESTDLMGYGWPGLGDPVLSRCDIDALAYVFAWALQGGTPAPPGPGPYDCSLD